MVIKTPTNTSLKKASVLYSEYIFTNSKKSSLNMLQIKQAENISAMI